MTLWDWLDDKLNPATKIDPVPLVLDRMQHADALRQARAYEVACGRVPVDEQFPRMKVDPSRRIFGANPLVAARVQENAEAYRERMYRQWLEAVTAPGAHTTVVPAKFDYKGRDDGNRGGPTFPGIRPPGFPRMLKVIDQHTEFQWFDGKKWQDTTAEGAAAEDFAVRHRTVTTMAGEWMDGLD